MKYFTTLLILMLSLSLFAQKNQLDKANDHYKEGEYAQAIPLFEEALVKKENLNAKEKLAHCYLMLNKFDKAEELLAVIVTNDKAKATDFLRYGEALMSLGKYDEAKKVLKEYITLEPGDQRGVLLLDACDKVKNIQPYFKNIVISPFEYNSTADDNSPVFYKNGIVFASDRNAGFKLMKQKAGATGRDYLSIYYAAFNDDSTYAAPSDFSRKINEMNANTGNASFTAKGDEIYFTRNSNVISKNNYYNLQLFSAKSSGDSWKDIEPLSFSTPEQNYMHPAISPNGKHLYFVSDRSNGFGGTDIYVSDRKKNGAWGKPYNLGEKINTAGNEGFPFMANDGKLYFCSKGHPGFGGFDIFYTQMDAEGNWMTPVNVGLPINSTYDDISLCINTDNNKGVFTSSRNGNGDDLFIFKIENELPLSVSPQAVFYGNEPTNETEVTETLTANNSEEIIEKQNHQKIIEINDTILPKPTETTDSQPIKEDVPTILVIETNNPEKELENKVEQVPANDQVQIEIPNNSFVTSTIEINNQTPVINTPAQQNRLTINDLEQFLKNKNSTYGRAFWVENVTYASGQFTVTPEIAMALDKVANILATYPKLVVEAGVHTESIGDDATNMEISQRRAEVVVEYLVLKGITPKRLFYKGYGETKPINHCVNGVECSQIEHLQNNRLEIKILQE